MHSCRKCGRMIQDTVYCRYCGALQTVRKLEYQSTNTLLKTNLDLGQVESKQQAEKERLELEYRERLNQQSVERPPFVPAANRDTVPLAADLEAGVGQTVFPAKSKYVSASREPQKLEDVYSHASAAENQAAQQSEKAVVPELAPEVGPDLQEEPVTVLMTDPAEDLFAAAVPQPAEEAVAVPAEAPLEIPVMKPGEELFAEDVPQPVEEAEAVPAEAPMEIPVMKPEEELFAVVVPQPVEKTEVAPDEDPVTVPMMNSMFGQAKEGVSHLPSQNKTMSHVSVEPQEIPAQTPPAAQKPRISYQEIDPMFGPPPDMHFSMVTPGQEITALHPSSKKESKKLKKDRKKK